jgi:hypothetical protein
MRLARISVTKIVILLDVSRETFSKVMSAYNESWEATSG